MPEPARRPRTAAVGPGAGPAPADRGAGPAPADPGAGRAPADPGAGPAPADPGAGLARRSVASGSLLRRALARGRRPSVPAVLAAAVVLTQIAYPLTPVGTARDRLTVATVLLFAAASVLHATTSRGIRAAAALVVVAGGGGLLAEAVGVATGVPFGSYSYAGTLGPALLGVPLVIPLAWVMMAWPAYLVGTRLGRGLLTRIAIAAAALASWDLFLDPQMVDAGHWRWSDPSPALPGVPAVPLTNYAGWALVALVLMSLLHRTVRTGPSTVDTIPYALYLWTYASSVLALAAFFGLPAAALWGGIGMGAVALPLAWSLRGPASR